MINKSFPGKHPNPRHEALAVMWAAGEKSIQIAAALDYATAGVVAVRRHNLFEETGDPRLKPRLSGNFRHGQRDNVVRLVRSGCEYWQIAQRLGIAKNTVAVHVCRARKFGELPRRAA